jgi:hypothetical protein
MDPDLDPGGPKTYGSDGSGSATLTTVQRKKALPDAHLLEEGEDVVRNVLVLEAGLAIKNPPKKTQKTPPKKTHKKWVF